MEIGCKTFICPFDTHVQLSVLSLACSVREGQASLTSRLCAGTHFSPHGTSHTAQQTNKSTSSASTMRSSYGERIQNIIFDADRREPSEAENVRVALTARMQPADSRHIANAALGPRHVSSLSNYLKGFFKP